MKGFPADKDTTAVFRFDEDQLRKRRIQLVDV
jgi:hypothetical protein